MFLAMTGYSFFDDLCMLPAEIATTNGTMSAWVDDSTCLRSFRGGRCHLRDQMLGDRLLALRADIGNTAKNVQFRHVAGGAPARNLVADGAIPVNDPPSTIFGKAGYVDEVELIESAVLDLGFVHEH